MNKREVIVWLGLSNTIVCTAGGALSAIDGNPLILLFIALGITGILTTLLNLE